MIKYLHGESDFFVGKKGQLPRYLVCSMQGQFPVLAKTGSESLAVIYRAGGAHISLAPTLAVSSSVDGGKSWTDPAEISPRWEDVRNPAFGMNDQGELVAVYWKAKNAYEEKDGFIHNKGIHDIFDRGASCFTVRSADGGKTWSEPSSMSFKNLRFGSPYGQIIQAPDGTLLMGIYGFAADDQDGKDMTKYVSCLIRSRDGGRTWGDESVVAHGYNETAFEFASDGTLIAAARRENGPEGTCIYTLFSKDMGYTWSEPTQITRSGEYPACLTLLQSGRLLLNFGRRLRPLGCGALISEDNGRTWNRDREILLAGDGAGEFDLGYPSTVQLDDGTIVTVLYYASGSGMGDNFKGWGELSCQAIHYREEDIL